MSKTEFEGILYLSISLVVRQIADRDKLSEIDATRSFYNSGVYEALSNEKTKLWHFSPLTLYNMYRSEQETGVIDFPEEL
ncbi:MAG: hypothetical protein LBJ91_07690 [Clostridiales Family XIII bacterium]|jgi:hypothetical protein|nr:hypothetical protein [Clostridiales Family XIII bacterium]